MCFNRFCAFQKSNGSILIPSLIFWRSMVSFGVRSKIKEARRGLSRSTDLGACFSASRAAAVGKSLVEYSSCIKDTLIVRASLGAGHDFFVVVYVTFLWCLVLIDIASCSQSLSSQRSCYLSPTRSYQPPLEFPPNYV